MDSQNKKTYTYTRNGKYLTEDQRNFYEENGYLIFRKLVEPDLLEDCKQRFVDICNKKVESKGVSAMKDTYLKKLNLKGDISISRIQNLADDTVFWKCISFKPVLDILESMIGPNITLFHSILINKPPNSAKDASRHAIHQDRYFVPLQPTNGFIGTWIALEPATRENGCLFVVPGSHKMKLLDHEYPPGVEGKYFLGAVNVDHLPTIDLVVDKGDTIFFHPLLLHGSGPNYTTGFRKSIICHYGDSDCTLADIRGTGYEKLEEERLEMSKKWGYGEVDYKTFWKRKSKIVRGVPGKFQEVYAKL